MNVPRQYKPEFFGILGLPPADYSKFQFVRYIEKFIQKNGWDCADTPTGEVIIFDGKPKGNNLVVLNRYYRLDDPVMRLLTGITNSDKFVLFEGQVRVNDSDKFYDTVYKRWKL